MSQPPQGVVEITNPRDEVICFRVSMSDRFHFERIGRIVVPIRNMKILIPGSASPLLHDILEVLQTFAPDIKQDMPLSCQMLRVDLACADRRLAIIKDSQTACQLNGKRATIRDRRSLLAAA